MSGPLRLEARFLATALTLLLAGCGEQAGEMTGPGRGLSDPRVRPAVVSTYPQHNAVGPFQVFSARAERAPHFMVELNKLVEQHAWQPDWIRIEGFQRPVRLVVSDWTSPYTALLYLLPMTVVEPVHFRPVPYEVGITYTVVVDTALTDLTARHLARPYRFSFTPEPYFRVMSLTPADGDSAVVAGEPLTLEFNAPVSANIGTALQVSPSVIGSWQLAANDSTAVQFLHAEPFAFATHYVLQVSASAADAHGHTLAAPMTVNFRTRGFEVVARWPSAANATDVDVLSAVGASMSGGVDTSSVREAFHVEPAIQSLLHLGNFAFGLQPYSELHSGTTYTVRIANTLRATDGTRLAAPYTYSFTTAPFRVHSGEFDSSAGTADSERRVRLHCTADVDSTSTVAAFSIQPNVAGSLQSPPGRDFSFLADQRFDLTVTYTVTVSAALRSRAGAQAVAPFSFAFTPGERP